MTDAEYAAQKARWQGAVDRWLPMLGLRWWHVRLCYHRDADDSGLDGVNRRLARCETNWAYLEATIHCYVPALVDLEDWEVELGFVHECMHIFLNEMRELVHNGENWLQHEERVATLLAKAFCWVAELALKEGADGGDPDAALQDLRADVPVDARTLVSERPGAAPGL